MMKTNGLLSKNIIVVNVFFSRILFIYFLSPKQRILLLPSPPISTPGQVMVLSSAR